MVKNGLIISYYFPPAGGGGIQRWTKFVKYLSRWGWRFTVITAREQPRGIKDIDIIRELPKSIRVIQAGKKDVVPNPNSKRPDSNYLLRWLAAFYYVSDSRASWNNYALRAAQHELNKNQYDVIICTLPPYSVAWLAGDLTKLYPEIPVVLDLRDPWTTNPYKIHPTFVHRKKDRKSEMEALSRVNYFTAVANFILDYYKKKLPGFPESKSIMIPNGYDEEDYIDLSPHENIDPKYFNIAFSGTFYSHLNNPDNLFKAFRLLKNKGIAEFRFHHVGKSAYDIKKLASKYLVHDIVKTWGYKTHRECLRYLKAMDSFVIILDERVKYAQNAIGGKLYEYLRFKKPILGAIPADSEAAEVIRETDSGLITSSYKPEKIAETLEKIITNQYRLSFAGIEKYNRERQALYMKNFLESKVLNADEFKSDRIV